jgi:hypothetical protein
MSQDETYAGKVAQSPDAGSCPSFPGAKAFLRAVLHEGGQIRQAPGLIVPPARWSTSSTRAALDQWGDETRRILKKDQGFIQDLMLETISLQEAAKAIPFYEPKDVRVDLERGRLGGLKIGHEWRVSKWDLERFKKQQHDRYLRRANLCLELGIDPIHIFYDRKRRRRRRRTWP